LKFAIPATLRRSNGMHSLEAECSTSVQQQSTSSTGVQLSKLGGHSHSKLGAFGTVGIRNWGCNPAVKTNQLVFVYCCAILLPVAPVSYFVEMNATVCIPICCYFVSDVLVFSA